MMQKLQDSVFSIVKTTSLSPAVFSFLQPTEEFTDKTPLGGILSDARLGWLALGPKFCIVDLKTGLKVAAHTFGAALGNLNTTVTCVVELPTPLTHYSKQLVISLEFEDVAGMVCIFHINGSQILRCIQTETVITDLAVCDGIPDGPFMCYDGAVIAGTKTGEILAFDLNRTGLIQALKDISNGDEHLVRGETNAATLTFLPLNEIQKIDQQRELAFENDDHIAAVLNEDSLMDNQYILRNPDSSVRMKADRDHIRVSALHYVPQLASVAVGFNFGAFQIWNLMTLDLEFTSQVNIECLPVTHFAFQEPCDDPRAFCYLWVVFSVIDRFEEEEFPLAVMYSLTYQGKRMLSATKCLYQEFITATLRFQVELSTAENTHLVGGRCISCQSYSISTPLGEEGEDNMLNICHLVWECWGESANCSSQYGMLLFDLDQWYKDQMPATCRLESNAFMSATWCAEVGGAGRALHARLEPAALLPYSHATRLEEHFYPNSLQYDIICLNTSEACVVATSGIQRQIIASLEAEGPTALLHPARLHAACRAAGLAPLYAHAHADCDLAEQRRYLLSVALEARLSRFLWRCARDWAPGTHATRGCTLAFLVDWCWERALDLKENAKDLTAPLFVSSSLPDRNVIRCLENCVQQLTQLTGLLDAVLTKCCNLLVPDALSEIEERHRAVGTVALYLQVVQWFLRVGLLPAALPYPGAQLAHLYRKRRLKLHRLQDTASSDVNMADRPCSLLYVDQLIEQEFGGEKITQMWLRSGSESNGLYPPPSLHSLLRLYLLPDIPEEHKHSLVLYLLLDYSMVYDEVVYEPVIRRLMQFPTMFGLSNTAIKATQAFWHLDHRDFDFAIDQLQCLTGNTLSEWQHNVVLSSLLAQKKHQAALQYLHVRKPAPVQSITKDKDGNSPTQTQISKRLNDQNKLEDWQSCCNLYLARQLVFEALDVIRLCVENAGSLDDKVHVLNFFFKGCRNTGQLSKLLQITLQPLEEEVFIKYLQDCKEQQTSDILIMYYLQQARYLEAQQYNNRLKNTKLKNKDTAASTDTLLESAERESARDTLVEVVCAALPQITGRVASCALAERDADTHVFAPKPMSLFVQANSPKNKFTYKSSFIQATIENASETWAQRPRTRRGMKRALCVEDTPFICTPKQRAGGLVNQYTSEQIAACTPPKRARLDFSGTPRSASASATRVSARLGEQLARLLDVPEARNERELHGGDESRAGTPHSILKSRREGVSRERDVTSPTHSHFSADSDDDMLETASNHTHFSDSTNKNRHLRFTIPTASEASPSPDLEQTPSLGVAEETETEPSTLMDEKEMDISVESYVTSASHPMNDSHQLESPPKKFATEENVPSRKTYKDSVRARRILSISNSSLSDDPNTSVESIADIPVTLVNPRYSAERCRSRPQPRDAPAETQRAAAARVRERRSDALAGGDDARGSKSSASGSIERCMGDVESETSSVEATGEGVSVRETERAVSVPRTPSVRRALRSSPAARRSRSLTPERADSPVASRVTRGAARTPQRSPSPQAALPAIVELPAQESLSEPHLHTDSHSLSARVLLRSRSRTPERKDKASATSPRLEAIAESTDSPPASPPASPLRRSLRSRSRTPEVEAAVTPTETEATGQASPPSLRSRSRTPEKLMSPKADRASRNKKSLTRLVLEANTFAKTKQMSEINEIETQTDDADERKPDSDDYTSENIIECTPMKSSKPKTDLMDVTFSPIVNKSVLQSSSDSVYKNESDVQLKPLPTFAMDETSMEKSVLHSCDSSADGPSINKPKIALKTKEVASVEMKSLPAAFKTFSETFEKSVLHSYTSSADVSRCVHENISVTKQVTSERYGDNMSAISSLKDVSSLLTSDSDMEMKDDSTAATRERDVAIVIQKEKEKLVEIEREINEIEGEMSDSTARGGSGSSGDEEIIEAPGEESEEEVSEEEISEEGSEESDNSTDANDIEVISLNDTESNESSSDTSALRIDEGSTELTDKEDAGDARDTDNQPQIEEMEAETAIQEIDKRLNQTDDEKVSIMGASVRDDSTMVMDPLEQAALTMLTDDNSVLDSDRSDVKLDYSDDNKESKASELKDNKEDSITAALENKTVAVEVIVEEMPLVEESEEIIVQSDVIIERESPKIDVVDAAVDVVAKSVVELETEGSKDVEMKEQSDDQQPQEPRTPSRIRIRTKSTSSNKSVRESQETIEPKPMEPIIEEQDAPVTRKRAGSVASNISITGDTEPKTPETQTGTPARRRAKTPTGTETRRILTRRASKELSGKLDDSSTSMLDESANLTPKRRSARRKSEDGASEGGGAASPRGRKGRKTLLAARPDLSVIPESGAEHANTDASEATHDLSGARRLTRYQRALLESPRAAARPAPVPAPRRRLSAASVASGTSEAWEEEASVSASSDRSRATASDVQPIDRISLLGKGHVEGSSDADESREQSTASPESMASDASKQRRARLGRAASEVKVTPKAAKVIRRGVSVDIPVESAERGSPAQGADSPARGRRASFNRACEALQTPTKGRRTSTDVRDSPRASPATDAATPRRARRASTQSNASATKSDAGRRSKKITPVVEEDKE